MKMPGASDLLGVPKDRDSDAGGTDLEDVAQDMLDAIKDNDVKALALAIRRGHEVCESDYGDDEEETDEE